MANLTNFEHLEKANSISPISNISSAIKKLHIKSTSLCDWCREETTSIIIRNRHGNFCSDACSLDFYDHRIKDDAEESRRNRFEYLEERSNSSWH